MKNTSILGFIVVVPIITSCSIHPLPSDVVRKATPAIINSIRCETREAIKLEVVEMLQFFGEMHNHRNTLDLAQDIKDKKAGLTEVEDAVEKKRIHWKAISAFNRYKDYAVGYDFEFTITEGNDETTGAKFAIPVPNGTFTLDFSAGRERERKNVRIVKLANSFRELFESLKDDYCAKNTATLKNWSYPIAGKIGMKELVTTFLELNEFVSKRKSKVGVSEFSDELTFTTKYSASIAPKVTLAPATSKFHLTEASGKLSSERIDVHNVKIAFTAPPGNAADGRANASPPRRGSSKRFDPNSPAERAKRKVRRVLENLRSQNLINRIPER